MHEKDTQESAGSEAASTGEVIHGEGDVMSLIDDVNRHLERIRSVQSRQEAEFTDLAERQRRLVASESALESQRTELDAEVARLAHGQAEHEAARAALQQERDEVESRAAEIRGREEMVAAARIESEAQELDLERRRRDLEDREEHLESEGEALRAQVAAAEAERDAIRTRIESIESALRDAEEVASAATERIADLERDVATRDEATEIADREREEEARAWKDREAEASKVESALREAVSTAEDRSSELESELQARDARLSELDDLLRKTNERAEEAASALDEAERRIDQLEQQCVEDQRQLKLAGGKLAELAEVVVDQTPRLERGVEAMALVGELESEIERLRAESAASEASYEARVLELERALADGKTSGLDRSGLDDALAEARAPLEARIAELESVAEASDSVPRSRHEEVKDRCRRAERRSDELETALSLANDRGQARDMAKRLRARAERVGEFARHLERRRSRLAALRRAIRDRGRPSDDSGSGTATFQDLQRLDAQRAELEEVREFLTRSEHRMVRRWARPRSVATCAWVLVILAVSVAAGWFGATAFLPSPGVATVSLRASTSDGTMLGPDAAAAWESWHTALATDPAFVHLVTQRLESRGLAPADGESGVSRLLARDLRFENEGRGRLRLLLEGSDARTLEPTLDAIATAMASESARQAPRRIDGVRATLPTERANAGGTGFADLVEGRWNAPTLKRMGLIAGGVFAAAWVSILGIYLLLSRSKRVFEAREGGEDLELAR